jgi:hypothetical protein
MWHAWKRGETRSHLSLFAGVRFKVLPVKKRKTANILPPPPPPPNNVVFLVFCFVMYFNVSFYA